MRKERLVILTGAGISAESGIKTFRDSNGLWEEHDVMDVASIDGWHKNPALVLDFYNQRRRQLKSVKPNAAHTILAELEQHFEVSIITQNVDNLHEQAGSTNVLHLHGELTKACSSRDRSLIYDIGYDDITLGQTADDNSQLRPYIVWFGEAVPLIPVAAEIVSSADYFAVIGTSLNVYPAAGLVDYCKTGTSVFLIDPNNVGVRMGNRLTVIKEKASVGVKKMRELLLENNS